VRIVIGDDAPLARSILSRLIESLGHEVVAEAGDPDALIRCCADEKPEVAIVDGRLPPEGGLAAIERLHRSEPDLPIVVIASLDEVGLLRSALAAGASGGLGRPFLRSQVEATLQRFARTE
jgi:DNA-binding NarL/FixJ family response regulator